MSRPIAPFDPSDMRVERVSGTVGKAFVREHHYSHGSHNGPMCWGLFARSELVGVIAFATPGSENVRASVFGPDHVGSVTELHRLVILDRVGGNAETWLIARGLRALKAEKPQYRAVLSFADPTEGHRGTIYQAANALYTGRSAKARFYLDPDGRLRHPRQNGHNVTAQEAADRGWVPAMREGKHRYLFLIGNRRERSESRRNLRLTALPYPKIDIAGGSQ